MRRVVEKFAIVLWSIVLPGAKLVQVAIFCAIEIFLMPAALRRASVGALAVEGVARPPVESPRIIPHLRWRAMAAEEGLA